MANEEHVAKLRQSVDVWNAWREENRGIRPDLNEADLTKADLSGAKLYEAGLNEAELTKAFLIGADLTGANLHEANLHEAILHEANLSGADSVERSSRLPFWWKRILGARISPAARSTAHRPGGRNWMGDPAELIDHP
jgi:hypothetical protein